MKFALAVHGTRGDIEPSAAVGLELQRRGHEVRIAVPPNLVSFVESAGGTAVAFGPDIQLLLKEDAYREFWKIQNSIKLLSDGIEELRQAWAEMATTLASLADGADLLVTGMIQQ
ncbi:MAG: glycosyltransferase, partial [Mycobacterium sp.]|uniref:glycosyltransferase n=1 Tax=Mycobacterium sp. TaxID=1785 RepID=UPI003CB30ECB